MTTKTKKKKKTPYVNVQLTNKQGKSDRIFRMYINPELDLPEQGELLVLTGKTDMVSTPMDEGGTFNSYSFSSRRTEPEYQGELTTTKAKKAWAYMLTLPDQHFDEVSSSFVAVNEPYMNKQDQIVTLQDVVITVVPNRKTPESVLARLK